MEIFTDATPKKLSTRSEKVACPSPAFLLVSLLAFLLPVPDENREKFISFLLFSYHHPSLIDFRHIPNYSPVHFGFFLV